MCVLVFLLYMLILWCLHLQMRAMENDINEWKKNAVYYRDQAQDFHGRVFTKLLGIRNRVGAGSLGPGIVDSCNLCASCQECMLFSVASELGTSRASHDPSHMATSKL